MQPIQGQVLQKDTSIITTAMNNRQSMINNLLGMAPTIINTAMDIDERVRKQNAEADAKTFNANKMRLEQLKADGKNGTPEYKTLLDEQNRYVMYGQFGDKVSPFQAIGYMFNDARQGRDPLETIRAIGGDTGGSVFSSEANKTKRTADVINLYKATPDEVQNVYDNSGLTDLKMQLKGKYSEDVLNDSTQNYQKTLDDLMVQRAQQGSTPLLEQQIKQAQSNLDNYKAVRKNYEKDAAEYENKKTEADRQLIEFNKNKALDMGITEEELYKLFGDTIDPAEEQTLIQMMQEQKDHGVVLRNLLNAGAANWTSRQQDIVNESRKQAQDMLGQWAKDGYGDTPEYLDLKRALEGDDDTLIQYLAKQQQQAELQKQGDSAMAQQAAAKPDTGAGGYEPRISAGKTFTNTQGADATKLGIKTEDGKSVDVAGSLVGENHPSFQGEAGKKLLKDYQTNPTGNVAPNVFKNNKDAETKIYAKVTEAQAKAMAPGASAAEQDRIKKVLTDLKDKGARYSEYFNTDKTKPPMSDAKKKIIADTARKELKYAGSDDEIVKRLVMEREGMAHTLLGEAVQGKSLDTSIDSINKGNLMTSVPNLGGGSKPDEKPAEPVKHPKWGMQLQGAEPDTLVGVNPAQVKDAMNILANPNAYSPAEQRAANHAISGMTEITPMRMGINPNVKMYVPGIGNVTAGDYLKRTGASAKAIEHYNNLVEGRNIDPSTARLDPEVNNNPALKAKYETAMKLLEKSSGLAKDDIAAAVSIKKQAVEEAKSLHDMAVDERNLSLKEQDLQIARAGKVLSSSGMPIPDQLKTISAQWEQANQQMNAYQNGINSVKESMKAFEQSHLWPDGSSDVKAPGYAEYAKNVERKKQLEAAWTQAFATSKAWGNQMSAITGTPMYQEPGSTAAASASPNFESAAKAKAATAKYQ